MPKVDAGVAAVATAITGFNKEWWLENRTVVRSRGAIGYHLFCIFQVKDAGSNTLAGSSKTRITILCERLELRVARAGIGPIHICARIATQ